jgi:hypothetical protein
MFRQPSPGTAYPAYSSQSSQQEYADGQTAQQTYMDIGGHPLAPVTVSRDVKSTLKLKLHVALSSLLSLALMCLAAVQSCKHFITIGYAPLSTDNSWIAIINAVVAVYGAITGMATRVSVTKALNLITIKALTTNGKFFWSAKTWAYMSHADGPWYTMGPLFIAGLAATAVISILPVAVVDARHFVYFNVTPSGGNEISCSHDNQTLSPNVWCTGSALGTQLLQSYSMSLNAYAKDQLLALDGQISSRRSLGYPWWLVLNREEELTKYNISGLFKESNKTSCVWVLDKVPIRCSWTNYTATEPYQQVQVISPYSQRVNNVNNYTNPPQGVSTDYVGDLTEIIGVGVFDEFITDQHSTSTAFVCTSRDPGEVHTGRYITTIWNGFPNNIYVDLANDTGCQPAYELPSRDDVRAIVNDMAGGIYQFASVYGSNTLIENLDGGYYDIGLPMFDDATSQLEDGMGSFMSLMLSNMYGAKPVYNAPFDKFTRVNGGQMVITVGLETGSKLFTWLVLAIVPLCTLTIALLMPLDYVPSWNIMNPMDALATYAIIDENKATATSRSSGIRLGMVGGRIVASNTNLPMRISKENGD